MAGGMMGTLRLLGIAPAQAGIMLQSALERLGPMPLAIFREHDFIALTQAEPDHRHGARPGPLRRTRRGEAPQGRELAEQRQNLACRLAPLLPADPDAALCPAAELPGLLAQAAPSLSAALTTGGATQEWHLTLHWPPELLLSGAAALAVRMAQARRRTSRDQLPPPLDDGLQQALDHALDNRAAPLLEALARLAPRLERLPAPGEAALRLVLQMPRGHGEGIERALATLPAPLLAVASLTLQGPLPPRRFAAWRVARISPPPLLPPDWARLGLHDWVGTPPTTPSLPAPTPSPGPAARRRLQPAVPPAA